MLIAYLFLLNLCHSVGKDYCAEKSSCGECTADPQCGWCGNKCVYAAEAASLCSFVNTRNTWDDSILGATEISLLLMLMYPTLVDFTDLQLLGIKKTAQRAWARSLVIVASNNQIAAGAIPRVPVLALQSTIQKYVQ